MSLSDRFPRLQGRELPEWVANAPDDDSDLVQAARESFNTAVDVKEADQ